MLSEMFRKLLRELDDLLIWLGLKRPKSFRDKLPPAARDSYDAIVKLFGTKAPSLPTNAAMVSQKPLPLESVRSNLWTVQLEKINPFMVVDFSPPSIHYDGTNENHVSFSTLHISFYDTVESSMVNKLASLIDGSNKDLAVKIVNKLGEVIESWKFQVRVVAVHPMTVFDYESNNPVKWSVECECLSWDIKDIS